MGVDPKDEGGNSAGMDDATGITGRSPRDEHPQPHEIAAYLDGRLDRSGRAGLEDHLADCGACAEEVALASRTLHEIRGGRRRIWWFAPLAAAAALVLVTIPLLRHDGAADATRFRGQDLPSTPERIQVLRPADRSVVARDSLTFVWRPAGEGASYSFRLTDEVGDILWESTLPDTVVRFVRELTLRPGARYYWYVDALFDGGRMVESGVREFEARE